MTLNELYKQAGYKDKAGMTFNKKQYGEQYDNKKGVIKNSEPIMVFQKTR